MARIKFDRSGGFMGQDISLDLDLNMLPASEALSLIHQIQKSDFFKLPERMPSPAKADEFLYTISVEIGSARRTIQVAEMDAPDALRPMLNLLSSIAVTG